MQEYLRSITLVLGIIIAIPPVLQSFFLIALPCDVTEFIKHRQSPVSYELEGLDDDEKKHRAGTIALPCFFYPFP
jgi:hypothetical protein